MIGRNLLAWLGAVAAACANAGCSPELTPIPGIGPVGEVERVATGYGFTEGPAVDPAGGVFFSDLQQEKVFRVDAGGDVSTFLEESRRANGLMVDEVGGRLVACESGAGAEKGVAQLVAYDLETGAREVLVASYEGRPFNRLNDLVIDRQRGVYFSDILGGEPGLPQERAAVYYAPLGGPVSRLVDDLPMPNGVLLSPDEHTLYVMPFGSLDLMAYPIEAPGVVGPGRVLLTLPRGEDGRKGGGDGLAVDTDGNLYVALPVRRSIAVVSPGGELLGELQLSEPPSNAVFGGPDRRTLHVTAGSSLYALRMEKTGHVFGTGPR